MQLDINQVQTIADSYSLGRISLHVSLDDVEISDSEKTLILSRTLIETPKGVFIIIYAANDDLHGAWWSSTPEKFEVMLLRATRLEYAKLLQTNKATSTLHKFDSRVVVFKL